MESILPDQADPRWMFLLNPRAGGRTKHRIMESVLRQWGESGIRFAETDAVRGALPAVEQGRQEGYRRFVAVGGDGTVQSLAACLRDSEDVMGIIPAGSGNGLAGWLGLRKDLKQNLEVLRSGQQIRMDTGTVNGHAFVNLAGVGFDAMVAHATRKSRVRGFWPYLLAGIKLVFADIYWKGTVTWPGGKAHGTFLTVIVANGAVFGYGFGLVPDARVNDGRFTLLMVHKVPRWRYVLAIPFLLAGRQRIFSWMEVLEVPEVTLSPEHPVYTHADGEALPFRGDCHFTMKTASLNLMVPRDCPALHDHPGLS